MSTKLSAVGRADGRAVLRLGLSAAAVLAATLLAPASARAQAEDRWSETCVRSYGVFSCVEQWGAGGGIAKVILVAPRDEKEAAASAERDRLWVARCRPVSRTDAYGVSRLRYAAPGCEFGRYQD
jgi:hypothetical protein